MLSVVWQSWREWRNRNRTSNIERMRRLPVVTILTRDDWAILPMTIASALLVWGVKSHP